jgi:transcriptional regulator with XRE-family HTH domain
VRLDPQHAQQDRQTLAGALRDLRQAAGLSGERVARRCHMSQSKVSRIETGRLLPTMVDVDRILTALGADEATRTDLMALARLANTEYNDIRASVRRGLHHRQRELAALEADAKEIRHFLPALITGLLQTPEYMRAAMDTPIDPTAGDTTAALALKLERQAVLHDKTKRFEFLLTESAVRWQLCEPALMALQLDRLVSLSWLPNLQLGVLPLSAQAGNGPYHTFVAYDEHLVTIELFTGQLVLRDPKDIDHYRSLFTFFAGHAVWGDRARSFLAQIADSYRQAS